MKDDAAVINWLANSVRVLLRRVDTLEKAMLVHADVTTTTTSTTLASTISLFDALFKIQVLEEMVKEEAADIDDPFAMMGGMGEEEVYKITLVEETFLAEEVVEEGEEKHGEEVVEEEAANIDDPLAMMSGMGEEEVYKVTLVEETFFAEKVVEEVEEKHGEDEEEEDMEDDDDELYNLMMNEACMMELELELEKEKEKELKKEEGKEDEEDDEVEMANFFVEAEKKAAKTKSEMGYKGLLYDRKKEKERYDSEMKLDANPDTRHYMRTSLPWDYYEEKKKRGEEEKKNRKEEQDKMQVKKPVMFKRSTELDDLDDID